MKETEVKTLLRNIWLHLPGKRTAFRLLRFLVPLPERVWRHLYFSDVHIDSNSAFRIFHNVHIDSNSAFRIFHNGHLVFFGRAYSASGRGKA